jgi:UDP-N-acetylglucosamine transferase subunit ALG13
VIFVTVGAMLPFDRLIRTMDGWAAAHREHEVFAQIGVGTYVPRNMPWERVLDVHQYQAKVTQCRLIVAHAGMGSVITTMEVGRPIVVLPRRASEGEHTTEHQLHTVQWLRGKPGIYVAMTDDELPGQIEAALSQSIDSMNTIANRAPEAFLAQIRQVLVEPR